MSSSTIKKHLTSDEEIHLPTYKKLPPIMNIQKADGRKPLSPATVSVDFSPTSTVQSKSLLGGKIPVRKSSADLQKPDTARSTTNQNSAYRRSPVIGGKPMQRSSGDVATDQSSNGIELIGYKLTKDKVSVEESRKPDPKPATEWTPYGTELPPCKICGDKASGLHYGVNTCEACKAFFRRTLKKTTLDFQCTCTPEEKMLGTDQPRKTTCPKCRYERCMKVGMSKDAIKIGRYSITRKRQNDNEVKQLKKSDQVTGVPRLGMSSKSSSSGSPNSTGQGVSSPEELSTDITSLSLQDKQLPQRAAKRRHEDDNDSETGLLYRSLTNSIILSLLENQHTVSTVIPPEQSQEELTPMEKLLSDKSSPHFPEQRPELGLDVGLGVESSPMEQLLSSDGSTGLQNSAMDQLIASANMVISNPKPEISSIETMLITGTNNPYKKLNGVNLLNASLNSQESSAVEKLFMKPTDAISKPMAVGDTQPHSENMGEFHITGDNVHVSMPSNLQMNNGKVTEISFQNAEINSSHEAHFDANLDINEFISGADMDMPSPMERLFLLHSPINPDSPSMIVTTHEESSPKAVLYESANVPCVQLGAESQTVNEEDCCDQEEDFGHVVGNDELVVSNGDNFLEDLEEIQIQKLQLSRFEHPALVIGKDISLGDIVDIIAELRKAATVLFDNTKKVSCEEIKKRHANYLEQYTLKMKVFGDMSNITKEEYLHFYNQTGIDIDNRQQILIEALKYLEESIAKLVKFAKAIPGFCDFDLDDQVSLVKVSTFEHSLVNVSESYACKVSDQNVATMPWDKDYHLEEVMKLMPAGVFVLKKSITDDIEAFDLSLDEVVTLRAVIITAPVSRFEHDMIKLETNAGCIMNPRFMVTTTPWDKDYHINELSKVLPYDFVQAKVTAVNQLARVGLTYDESVILKAIVITFPDRCVLKEPEKVENIHNRLIACFLFMLNQRPPNKAVSIQKIMTTLFKLRELAVWDTQIVQEMFEVWPVSSNHQLVKEFVS